MSAELSTAELKNELHKLVVETDDEKILLQVKSLFTVLREGVEEEDWWDTISEKEKAMINRGLQQLNNGESIPHHVVREALENDYRGSSSR